MCTKHQLNLIKFD